MSEQPSDEKILEKLRGRLQHKREKLTRSREYLASIDNPTERMCVEAEIKGIESEIERLEYHIDVMEEQNGT